MKIKGSSMPESGRMSKWFADINTVKGNNDAGQVSGIVNMTVTCSCALPLYTCEETHAGANDWISISMISTFRCSLPCFIIKVPDCCSLSSCIGWRLIVISPSPVALLYLLLMLL